MKKLNSLPKSKRNLLAKLEMLKSVNEEIPIKAYKCIDLYFKL